MLFAGNGLLMPLKPLLPGMCKIIVRIPRYAKNKT